MTKPRSLQLGRTSTPLHSLGRREHLTFRGNIRRGRHGWLRLTPAYSLHVVEGILSECTPDEVVLDPFSGTGTTPLAAAALGLRAHAVDINPFLVWLGNLKLQRFSADSATKLKTAARDIAGEVARRRRQAWVPDLHAIEKWWSAPTLRQLAQLHELINEAVGSNGRSALDVLRIAFCRVLIETANVSFGHQSMSFKKVDPQKQLFEHSISVPEIFEQAVQDIAESIQTDQPSADGQVFLGDSRALATVLPLRCYTTVITSPPYPNRMSYIRKLRPYMYWLGYLATGRQAGEIDWQAIGGTWGCATSLLNSWAPDPGTRIPYAHFADVIAGIAGHHDVLARYVHKYFEDVVTHLHGLKDVLAAGARCHYVVGNSKFYSTIVPVEEIYAAIFNDLGYEEVAIETIRKRNSKKELYEYIVSAVRP